jgi:CHAD domain-containing protein
MTMMPLETTAPVMPRSRAEVPPAERFSLDPGESTGSGLQRILIEQVELGAWHLERAPLSDSHVHEVRKATKRVRAVLRMLSDDIDAEDYTRLNVEVRDIARDLSQIRSAVVRVDLLESLVVDGGQLTADTQGLHGELVAAADKQREGLEGSVVRDLLSRFVTVHTDIEAIQVRGKRTASLGGVRRTYRRGRRSMAHAYDAPTIESFHIWRKQVKYLRHQMEILEWGGPPAVAELVSDLEVIGEGLGMDHDLADLDRSVDDIAPSTLSPKIQRRLSGVIMGKRADLELRLKPTAARVYSAKPGAFFDHVIPRLG